MKPPKLRPNESAKSFRARVKKWEKATGKKYPRSFSEQSNEERILKGDFRLGIEKRKDYSSNYDDEIKESQTQKAIRTQRKKSTQDVKEESKEASLESLGKTDFSKVKLPTQKTKLQIKDSPKKPSPTWGVDNKKKTTEQANKTSKTKNEDKAEPLKIKKKKKYTARDRMREKNEERFGKEAVNKLKIKHSEWKKARKEGKLKEWEKKYKRK